MTFSKRQDHSGGEQISGCQGLGEGEGRITERCWGGFGGGDGTVLCPGSGWLPESRHVSQLTGLCTKNKSDLLDENLKIK